LSLRSIAWSRTKPEVGTFGSCDAVHGGSSAVRIENATNCVKGVEYCKLHGQRAGHQLTLQDPIQSVRCMVFILLPRFLSIFSAPTHRGSRAVEVGSKNLGFYQKKPVKLQKSKF